MLTKEDFALAKNIIKDLRLPEEMGCDSGDDEFNTDIIYNAMRESPLKWNEFTVENGISKVVIIPNDANFVIKIPLTGMWYYEETYNEEEDEWEYNEDPTFECFTGAEYGNCGCDYCDDEVYRIGMAEAEGFGKMFPQTDWLANMNGKNFYIQEKVHPSREYTPKVSEESRSKSANLDPSYCHGSAEWRAAIIENYGEEFWKNFCIWDSAEGGTMRDMHCGNYGYNMEGKPVIFDASGFES